MAEAAKHLRRELVFLERRHLDIERRRIRRPNSFFFKENGRGEERRIKEKKLKM